MANENMAKTLNAKIGQCEMENFFDSLLASAIGSAAGSGIAGYIAWRIYLKQRRDNITNQYIDEFYSENFLIHRIEAAKLRRALIDDDGNLNEKLVSKVARGFWNPGYADYYEGDFSGLLNQHQHVEAILMYLAKLCQNMEEGLIDEKKLQQALQDSYIWLDQLLYPLEKEILRQVEEYRQGGGSPTAYSRIEKLSLVANRLGIKERTGPIKKPSM